MPPTNDTPNDTCVYLATSSPVPVNTTLLDSTPLGLLVKRFVLPDADRCRQWVAGHVRDGVKFHVPEIVAYEFRRELLRLNSSTALTAMDRFVSAEPDRLLVVTSPALRLAAELWAEVRRRGIPTADRYALDINVTLAAQVKVAGLDLPTTRVATSNAKYLGLFVLAADWQTI